LHGGHRAAAELFASRGSDRWPDQRPRDRSHRQQASADSPFVKKLTLTPTRMTQADAERWFAAGWDEAALHSAIAVCCLFNFMNRLVDAHGIEADRASFTERGRKHVEMDTCPVTRRRRERHPVTRGAHDETTPSFGLLRPPESSVLSVAGAMVVIDRIPGDQATRRRTGRVGFQHAVAPLRLRPDPECPDRHRR